MSKLSCKLLIAAYATAIFILIVLGTLDDGLVCNICMGRIWPWQSSEQREFKQTYGPECGSIISATMTLHGTVHRDCHGPAKTNISITCGADK